MENSLQQYLDLYKEHKNLIERKSAPELNKLREEAYNSLKKLGLPSKGTENYENIDINEMLAPDFGLNISRIPLDVNLNEGFKCGLPQLSTSLFFLLNDLWAESKNARNKLPEGIEVGPLSQYIQKEAGKEKYGEIADMANPIVALNTMLVQEGLYVRVKRGVKVEKPLQLISLLESTMPLMAVRRILLVLEDDAELKLLSCSHTAPTDHPMASLSVAEMFVGKNAHLDFYDMEESGRNTRRLMSIYLHQEEGSRVLLENFTLHNGRTRNEFYCNFAGPESDLRLYGLGIESGSCLLDTFSRVNHNVGHCHTEELFKYIVEEEATGSFTGRIFVAPGASKTEAYQSNRNLVTSDKAKMYSKPQLEIYNDDVKCSHGSATGQLDAMQLFYMRSRGLSKETARLLLKQAFMADVIEGIKIPLLRDRLHTLIERRFLGQDSACGDCSICSNTEINV